MLAAGVDAHPRGWVAVLLEDGRFRLAAQAAGLSQLLHELPGCAAVGIDIPIGLPPEGRRRCDLAAQRRLGPRRSSVFLTPPRAALVAATYADARAAWPALSAQAFNLGARILEAEPLAEADPALFEVHPELSFAAMAGRPPAHSKKSWAGLHERLRLLADQGIELPVELGPAGEVPPFDVIDAAAAAWSAGRRAAGRAEAVAEPELYSGRPVSIWF